MKRILALLLVLSFMPRTVFAQADMLNIHQAQIVNAPNVADWPITTALTSVSFDGAVTRVDFTKRDGPNRWPNVTPPGWEGPLEYTLWLFVKVQGTWVGSGFVQFWNGRDGTGTSADPDVPSRYMAHWYYSERWSPIFGHGPIAPGEDIGFMVTSGNQRDSVGPDSVMERSNVVTFPATDNGHYSFSAAAPPPVVTPPVVAPPVSTPPVMTPPSTLPATDWVLLLNQQAIDYQILLQLQEELKATRKDIADFREAVKSKWSAVVNNPVFKYGLAAVTGFLVTHKWGG